MDTVGRRQAALLADILGPSAQQEEIIFAENFLICLEEFREVWSQALTHTLEGS